jgi:hypothetical protein
MDQSVGGIAQDTSSRHGSRRLDLSRSPPPPTTWCVCPSYWAPGHSHTVLRCNAEHAAETLLESPSNTPICAIMAALPTRRV